jgi:hypothetical protein
MKKILNFLACTFILAGLINGVLLIYIWPESYGVWVTWFCGATLLVCIGGLILIANIKKHTRK